jgi:drug/metabolite transporter (DMT)-like permease
MSEQAFPRRALILLILLTIVWGTNWPMFKLAVREISVWTFRALSVPIAGLTILAYARMRGHSLRVPRRYWKTVFAATMCYLVVWNIASTYAAVMIPSGQAAVLGFTMPLWSAAISWLLLGEKMNPRLAVALLLGAGAVALLMVPGLSAYAQAPAGFALGLAAGLGWAVGTLILKRGAVAVPVAVLTGWQLMLTSVPVILGAATLGDYDWFMPSWQTIALVLYIALVPMSIGNVTWFSIVGLLPVNVAGLSAIMVPVVAMLTGTLLMGEPLGLLQLAAMVCSVSALSLVLLKPASVR